MLAVGRGEIAQVVDDVLQEQCLVVQGGDDLRVRGEQPVAGDLQPAADVGQRGPQLVGDVADHGLALGFQLFAARGEVVEGGGQIAGLVLGGDGDAGVLVRRLLGRGRQGSQGTDETGRDHGGHGDGDGQDQRRDTDDLGFVGGGEVETRGLPAQVAQVEPGPRGDVGVELGAARVLDTGRRLLSAAGTADRVTRRMSRERSPSMVGGPRPAPGRSRARPER